MTRYRAVYKSTITGHQGAGEWHDSESRVKAIVDRANDEFPEIHHWMESIEEGGEPCKHTSYIKKADYIKKAELPKPEPWCQVPLIQLRTKGYLWELGDEQTQNLCSQVLTFMRSQQKPKPNTDSKNP